MSDSNDEQQISELAHPMKLSRRSSAQSKKE